MAIGSPHVTDNGHNSCRSLVQYLDKYLLWYFVLLGIPVNIHYLYTVSMVNSTASTLWCVVLAFNNLACFSTDMQFIRCACMLHYRFAVINSELETIAAVWHFKRGWVSQC
jgi:hypothetical protein